MKYIITCLVILSFCLPAHAVTKRPPSESRKAKRAAISSCVESIELYDNKPSRPYTVISPVSKTGALLVNRTADKVFNHLKKQACKLNADALIQYQCNMVPIHTSNVYANNTYATGSSGTHMVPSCSGVAVKWR